MIPGRLLVYLCWSTSSVHEDISLRRGGMHLFSPIFLYAYGVEGPISPPQRASTLRVRETLNNTPWGYKRLGLVLFSWEDARFWK